MVDTIAYLAAVVSIASFDYFASLYLKHFGRLLLFFCLRCICYCFLFIFFTGVANLNVAHLSRLFLLVMLNISSLVWLLSMQLWMLLIFLPSQIIICTYYIHYKIEIFIVPANRIAQFGSFGSNSIFSEIGLVFRIMYLFSKLVQIL